MYSDWSVLAWGLGLAIFWLGILSYLVWQQNKFLKSLFPSSGERDIRKKFEEVLDEIKQFSGDLDKIKLKISEIEGLGLKHVQRIELLRFNPYDDTGGDQSYSMVFLDGDGSGFVITSLHARSGTRVFAKPVLKGKSEKYKFSQEEEEVVKKAINNE